MMRLVLGGACAALLVTGLVTGMVPGSVAPSAAARADEHRAAPAAGAGTFTPLTPARLLDTRTGIGARTPGARGTVHLQVTGRGGVPDGGVAAVVLNVAAVAPASPGFVAAYADGQLRPTASNLNFPAGRTVSNLVIAPVDPATGRVALYNGATSPTDLTGDVSGYYLAGTPTLAGAFTTLSPARVLDTRTKVGAPTPAGRGTIRVRVTDTVGVPATDVRAVVLTVTVTRPVSGGYVTVHSGDGARPAASNVNFAAGQTVANLVVAPVGADGTVSLYNGSTGSTPLLGDVVGWFRSGIATAAGTFTALTPTRLLDTRRPEGAARPAAGRSAQFAANGTIGVDGTAGSGQNGIDPANVAAVVLNVTAVNARSHGYVEAWRADTGTTRPLASSLSVTRALTTSNLSFAGLNGRGDAALHNGTTGPLDLLADVAGYYNAGTRGTIAGTVTDASSGAPVRRVSVELKDAASQYAGAAYTDANGRYRVANVVPGDYQICPKIFGADTSASPGGYQKPLCSTARYSVVAGEATLGVDAALQRGGAISGTVSAPGYDSTYEYYYDARFASTDGTFVTSTRVGFDGRYLVQGLPPGDYTVCFFGAGPNGADGGQVFAPQCYDGKAWDGGNDLPTGTTPVTARVGEVHSGIDATLVPKL